MIFAPIGQNQRPNGNPTAAARGPTFTASSPLQFRYRTYDDAALPGMPDGPSRERAW